MKHSGCKSCTHDDETGDNFSLWQLIDTHGLRALNTNDQIGPCLKPYHHRFDMTTTIQSDQDEQLILYIPFTANLKLKAISILSFADDTSPTILKAYINRTDIDFDNIESMTPVQYI
jgi:hypothetical protein